MKTKVDVKNVVRLVLSNCCVWSGCYDSSDDWAVVAFGDTYEEAVEAASLHPRIAELFQPRICVDVVTVFVWKPPEGGLFTTPVDGDSDYCCSRLKSPAVPAESRRCLAMDVIKKTRAYKLAVRRKTAAEQRKQQRLVDAGEQHEREEYARLHKKFVVDKPPCP